MSRSLHALGLLALAATSMLACGGPANDPAAASTAAAYTGVIPQLEGMDKPPNVPDSWPQPSSEGVFNQYGYCGATAAANLLRWYGREVSPQQAIDDGCWSYVGTLPSAIDTYFHDHQGDLGCRARTLKSDADALAYLEDSLVNGRPVVLMFMIGSLDAHWVTAFGVKGHGDDTKVEVETWGGYATIKWADLAPAWRAGWGGPYPHITCDAVSPLADDMDVADITGAGDYSGDDGVGGSF